MFLFRAVFGGVLGPIVLLIIIVIIINVIQKYKPQFLPKALRTWEWLPVPLRSLAFYDKHIFGKKCCCCRRKVAATPSVGSVHENDSYTTDVTETV